VERNEGEAVVRMGADGTPTRKIDMIAEEVILDILYEKDLPVKVISEEAGEVPISDDYEYVLALDPIDGTFNSLRNIPFYSISMAFSTSNSMKDIFFGYIFDLSGENEYYATREGAFKNGRPLKVSRERELSRANVIYYGGDDWKIVDRIKRTRLLGCASLELCLVAEGKMDAFVDCRNSLRVFDVAAGILMVSSAGGKVSKEKGQEVDNGISIGERINIVASNELLHDSLVEALNEG